MRIYGKARVGLEANTRTKVFLSIHHRPQVARLSTADIKPVGWFPLAGTSDPALASWLATAINHVLDGEPVGARPAGAVERIASFHQHGASIYSWNLRDQGHRIELVRGEVASEVGEMKTQLNALLEMGDRDATKHELER